MLNLSSNKTFLNWSSGKDAALALHKLLCDKNISVDLLLTNLDSNAKVAMHSIPHSLLEKQLAEINIPAEIISLPEMPSMEVYEKIMGEKMKSLSSQGFTHAAYGDIFLEDLKEYRETKMQQYGMKCLFPLWKRDTKELITEFMELGFKAVIICVDIARLPETFLGKVLDHDLISSFPSDIDPCGENGEFHTFCFDAPYFKKPVNYTSGENYYKQLKNPVIGKEDMEFAFCEIQ